MRKIYRGFTKNGLIPSSNPNPEVTPTLSNTYEALYEAHALKNPISNNVGGGDYETIGIAELDILRYYGLGRDSSLFDFGCGTGRLGKHAINYLNPNKYFGTDISQQMLRDFRLLVKSDKPFFIAHQKSEEFPLIAEKIDFFAAFSVFTHMESEDSYRYLRSLKSITHPSTTLVISLIDYNSTLGQEIFLEQSSISHESRWAGVRSFCTSRDSFEIVAGHAGWVIHDWVHGDSKDKLPKTSAANEYWEFGQSVVQLKAR
jgi:SAM-dependent methyltransferase